MSITDTGAAAPTEIIASFASTVDTFKASMERASKAKALIASVMALVPAAAKITDAELDEDETLDDDAILSLVTEALVTAREVVADAPDRESVKAMADEVETIVRAAKFVPISDEELETAQASLKRFTEASTTVLKETGRTRRARKGSSGSSAAGLPRAYTGTIGTSTAKRSQGTAVNSARHALLTKVSDAARDEAFDAFTSWVEAGMDDEFVHDADGVLIRLTPFDEED